MCSIEKQLLDLRSTAEKKVIERNLNVKLLNVSPVPTLVAPPL
jgi:hypothetical protein